MSETPTLRADLPPLPERMRSLPIDHRSYPVPFFVALVDGKPDHRVMDGAKMTRALQFGLCWMCGQKLGAFKSFCIGPMCSITRTIGEPPSHLECLRFATTACPFMTRPNAKRRAAGMPDDAKFSETGLRRNPGAVCVWTTRSFRAIRGMSGERLFSLGDPVSAEWYAEGAPATRAQVDESIDSGLPLLVEQAMRDPRQKEALAELSQRTEAVRRWLDTMAWPADVLAAAEGGA